MLTLQSVWVQHPSVVTGRLHCKKHRLSDETLNRGPDSLWSLKIPGCSSKKNVNVSRGVTPASWPNSPIGLWPSWPLNHPHTLIGFISVSSPPVSWCVVGVLAHYGCRRIIQVDAAHWWQTRRFPPLLCKALWVPRKALYKCNKWLLLLLLLIFWKNAHNVPWTISLSLYIYIYICMCFMNLLLFKHSMVIQWHFFEVNW